MSSIAVKGGIGDFLQCVPYMLEHPEHQYLVASHSDCVQDFFSPLHLKVEELSLGRLKGVANCPRQLFLDCNPFKQQEPVFSNKPVIGVHLGGSGYSLNIEKRFGFPPKALPLTVLEKLVEAAPDYNFLLFGEVTELLELKVKESPNLRALYNTDITVCLSRVAECSALIGSDSAFKTMSAMLRIPTIVWVGDYKDDFRDANFIDPYVDAGVMSVFRYKDLNSSDEVNAGVQFSLDRVADACVA